MKLRPVLVLAISLTVQMNESLEGIRQGNDFRIAVDLHPTFAVELGW